MMIERTALAPLTITVAIPAYNRAAVLPELLDSILAQDSIPDEIIICEDMSRERTAIREVCDQYRSLFEARGMRFSLFENAENFGYDKNVREVISRSSCEYVILMGNDDRMFSNCIQHVRAALLEYPTEARPGFVGRAYAKFDERGRRKGLTRICKNNRLHLPGAAEAGTIFSYCAFVSGIVFNVERAKAAQTAIFDGSLYYQYYLALSLSRVSSVLYLSTPIIEGRMNNPPDFGNANNEKKIFTPGGYAATARIAMWSGLLTITRHVCRSLAGDQEKSLRRMLDNRYFFHIAEMVSLRGRGELITLFRGFFGLGLMRTPLSLVIFSFAIVFGRMSRVAFSATRSIASNFSGF
jgi:glycosyltransferase involved in cell wall biosynthesis